MICGLQADKSRCNFVSVRSPAHILIFSSYPFIAGNLAALLGEAEWARARYAFGQVHSLEQLTAYLTTHPEAIVLADIDAGIVDIGRIVRLFPRTRFLALSMFVDTPAVKRCVAQGAVGYVLKTAPLAEFEEALRAITAGRRYFSESVVQALLKGKVY